LKEEIARTITALKNATTDTKNASPART